VYERHVSVRLGWCLGFVLGVVGCGEGAAEPSALPYPASATSSAGSFLVVATEPGGAPIVRGVHDFDVQIQRVGDTTPATGLSLDVIPWMPAMGHGAPYDGDSIEVGDGRYRLEGISLFMAGVWELRVALEPEGEHAILAFDVR